MDIEITRSQAAITLEEFADLHGLVMSVIEHNDGQRILYSAYFKNTEIKKNSFLSGESGWGASIEEAIENYKNIISGKVLIYNAYGNDRKTIYVPYLKPEKIHSLK